jgi:hypothetical protein
MIFQCSYILAILISWGNEKKFIYVYLSNLLCSINPSNLNGHYAINPNRLIISCHCAMPLWIIHFRFYILMNFHTSSNLLIWLSFIYLSVVNVRRSSMYFIQWSYWTDKKKSIRKFSIIGWTSNMVKNKCTTGWMVNVEVKTWESYFFMFVDSHERNAVFMIYDCQISNIKQKKTKNTRSYIIKRKHLCHDSHIA